MHAMTTADQALEFLRQHRPSTLQDSGQSTYPKECNSKSTRLIARLLTLLELGADVKPGCLEWVESTGSVALPMVASVWLVCRLGLLRAVYS